MDVVDDISRLKEICKKTPLEELKKFCTKYDDPDYVYKKCTSILHGKYETNWIIIMKKLVGVITNEERKGVKDANKAKFRANKLKVVAIFNANDPLVTEKVIVNTF